MPEEKAKARVPVRESTLQELRKRKTADGQKRTYDELLREELLNDD